MQERNLNQLLITIHTTIAIMKEASILHFIKKYLNNLYKLNYCFMKTSPLYFVSWEIDNKSCSAWILAANIGKAIWNELKIYYNQLP